MKVTKQQLFELFDSRVDYYSDQILFECECKDENLFLGNTKQELSEDECEECLDEKNEDLDEAKTPSIPPEMVELMKKNLAKQGGYVQKIGKKIVGRPFVNVIKYAK